MKEIEAPLYDTAGGAVFCKLAFEESSESSEKNFEVDGLTVSRALERDDNCSDGRVRRMVTIWLFTVE